MSIVEGQKAPALSLPADTGGHVDLTGPAVVYFYPKDDTPGCTNEGKDFSALIDDFRALGVAVIGVSRDSVKKHDRFKAKHDLKVVLAADEDGVVTEAWGVWVEKQLYGRKYMGIERATFLIDGSGVVRRAWRNVRVPGHAAEVLEAARGL